MSNLRAPVHGDLGFRLEGTYLYDFTCFRPRLAGGYQQYLRWGGFSDPPQQHANALPALAGMNSTTGITLFCQYPPNLSHIVMKNGLLRLISSS